MSLESGNTNEDYIWELFGRNSRVVIDFGNKCPPKVENLYEYHLFCPNLEHENNPNIFVNKVDNVNLDDYCKKMEIFRINLLRVADKNIWKNAKNILEYTDVVEFFGTQPCEMLKEKGFKYFYGVFGKNLVEPDNNLINIALRVDWKEGCLPTPNLGIMCINLETKTERREFMVEQLDRLGFPYKIFKAVDGKKINIHDNVVEYNENLFGYKPLRNRHLSYGEIGCMLSHYFVYKKMLATSHDYFLILEDDTRILDINLARQQLLNIPSVPFDLCLLSASMNRPMQFEKKINEYYSYISNRQFNRANSILFSRAGLEKAVMCFEKNGICLAADDFLEGIRLFLISANIHLYACAEDKFKSDIWNVYKDDESYNQVSHDKPIYNKYLCMTTGGYSRMGNGLFQYAMLKAQALEKNMFISLTSNDPEIGPFVNIDYTLGKPREFVELDESKFTTFQYSQEFVDNITSDKNFYISGYFQSEKYFNKYKNIIKQCFEIHPNIRKEARCIYSKYYDGRKICGVHIRLADVRGDPTFLYSEPSEKYLTSAIGIMKEKLGDIRYLICSNDMQECIRRYKHIFPSDTVYFVGKDKFTDFALLSFCDHNILTAGSFSWWAGYLNKNLDKVVIGIDPIFNHNVSRTISFNERDYYPEEWIKIPN